MFESNNLKQDLKQTCPSHHRDFVMKSAMKFMEIWGQGLDGTFMMKCENGNARLELSFDLGCQDNIQMKEGNSVSSTNRHVFGSPRKSRSSPSTLRRSRARAEAYQLKNNYFETKKEEKVLDSSSKEKVFVSEVVPVAEVSKTEADEKETVKNSFDDDSKTKDSADASTEDDSTDDDTSSSSDDANTEDDASIDDDDDSEDDERSDLAFIVLCENYINELLLGRNYLSPVGYFKEDNGKIEDSRKGALPWLVMKREFTDIHSEYFVIKVIFWF